MSENHPIAKQDQDSVMSVSQWLVTLIIISIPIVGFIMMIVWAIGSNNKNKTNLFRAMWIMIPIMFLLMFAIMTLFIIPNMGMQF